MTTTLPRITSRVDLETQQLLSQAAAISGISSINSFVLHAAVEKAKQIMEREQRLKLSARDAAILAEALEEDEQILDKLHQAALRYSDKKLP